MKLGRRILYNPIIQKLAITLLYLYIWLVFITSKRHTNNSNDIEQLVKNQAKTIFVFWHGRLCLMPIFITRLKLDFSAVTSAHKDGNIVAGVIAAFGSKIIRGSSSNGATNVIRSSLKALKNSNSSLSIVPDGPRGPRMRINSEFPAIAQKTGAHIIPVTYSCKKAKIFKSWDRFMLPGIFNDITFEYGKTYQVPKEANKEQMNNIKSQIEAEMNEITWRLDSKYSHHKIEQG